MIFFPVGSRTAGKLPLIKRTLSTQLTDGEFSMNFHPAQLQKTTDRHDSPDANDSHPSSLQVLISFDILFIRRNWTARTLSTQRSIKKSATRDKLKRQAARQPPTTGPGPRGVIIFHNNFQIYPVRVRNEQKKSNRRPHDWEISRDRNRRLNTTRWAPAQTAQNRGETRKLKRSTA